MINKRIMSLIIAVSTVSATLPVNQLVYAMASDDNEVKIEQQQSVETKPEVKEEVKKSSNSGKTLETTGKVVNVDTNLRVRENPSTSSNILDHLYSGNKVNIKEDLGSWYAIEHKGKKAYVHKDYISIGNGNNLSSNNNSSSSNSVQALSGKGRVINVDSSLRIRQEPNKNSNIVGQIYGGNNFDIKGKSGNWYKIQFNGKTGFIHGDYVKVLNGSENTSKPSNSSKPNNNSNENNSSKPSNDSKPESSSRSYKTVLNAMKEHIGTPYVYGGSGEVITNSSLNNLKSRFPSNASKGHYNIDSKYVNNGYRAFDCSSLMQWGFSKAGISIGRSTYDQINSGKEVSVKNAQPGDLLFYGDLSHVGMYVGDGQWIESPRPGRTIRITDVPWNKVTRARRVL